MAKATVRQEKPFGSDHGVIHEAVVTGRKVGADEAFWSQLAHNEWLFADVVALVQGKTSPEVMNSATTSLAEAKAIMGNNFHNPEGWAKACGFRLSKAHKEIFAGVPFSAELPNLVKDTHILVPILKLSVMQLHAKHNALFYSKEDPWYSAEEFATEQADVGWMLLRREILPGSTSKTYIEQQAMLPEGEYLPSAAELLQAIVCHAVLSGERLLPDVYARTSSVDSYGRRVGLGYFGAGGLHVDAWRDYANSYISAVGARKLS